MVATISADGLVKRYGEQAALDGFDLEVERGTVFGLLGPNGAGKTTAVRAFATLLRVRRGRRPGRRPRPGDRAARGAPADRPQRPDAGGRRDPRRPAEPRPLRPAQPDVAGARRSGGPTSCWSSSGSRMPADKPVKHYSGRYAAPARPRGHAPAPTRGAVPRRADHGPRPAQPHRGLGGDPVAGRRTARRCCSRPSTSTRPTSWPAGSP